MMELDPELSDAEKADLVNQRLHEIMNDHPGCTVEANYAYSSQLSRRAMKMPSISYGRVTV
jgi:hypothetical protein